MVAHVEFGCMRDRGSINYRTTAVERGKATSSPGRVVAAETNDACSRSDSAGLKGGENAMNSGQHHLRHVTLMHRPRRGGFALI